MEQDIIRSLVWAGKAVRELAAPPFAELGLHPGQNVLLEALWEQDGQTPGELAARMRVAVPTAVRMAQRMEATGLVTRTPDQDDRRLVRIGLTDRGRQLREPLSAVRRQLSRTALAGIDEAEQRALGQTLLKVLANLGRT